MSVLGLSGLLHDCAFAVVSSEGEILVHSELERDLRLKEIPGNSLLYYLQDKTTIFNDDKITSITSYLHNSNLKLFGALDSLMQAWDRDLALRAISPDGRYQVVGEGEKDFVLERLKNLLNNRPKLVVSGHHKCHAAEAFFRSSASRALIISIDGGGFDYTSDKRVIETHTTAWIGERREGVRFEECIKEIVLEPTLTFGSLYNVVTKALGFSTGYPNGSQAGSTMGMAAYGDWGKTIHLVSNSLLWENTSAGNTRRAEVIRQREKLTERLHKLLNSDDNLQSKYDIAAGLQFEFTRRLKEWISEIVSVASIGRGFDTVIFTGGCSLNCAALGEIVPWLSTVLGEAVSIECSNIPYDAGLSLGSAFMALSHSCYRPGNRTPYLGRDYSSFEICSTANSSLVEKSSLDIGKICRRIGNGEVGAVFYGRSESGRRALGNRSIFADPRNPSIRDVMNAKVKHRPLWRPFAPSILKDHVEEWFQYDIDSPYMSFAIPFRKHKSSLVPSVVHADGTGRLQTVDSRNVFFYSLLSEWYKQTGVPILINTSFNDSEPIVETPAQALATFLKTDIDFLVLPDIGLVLNKSL